MSEIQSNPSSPPKKLLPNPESIPPAEQRKDTVERWYQNDTARTNRNIGIAEEILELAKVRKEKGDTSLVNLPEIKKVQEQLDDLKFYSLVQKEAKNFDRLSLEQFHNIYGEGAAWLVYGQLAGIDIRKTWLDTIKTYKDELGVFDAVQAATEKEFKDAATNSSSTDSTYFQTHLYDSIVQAITDTLSHLPHPVRIVYGRQNEEIRVPSDNGQRTFLLRSSGFHANLVAETTVDDQMPLQYYDKLNNETTVIGIDEELKNSGYTDDKLSHILVLAHEAGHDDEREKPIGKHTETRRSTVFATEYYSTLLELKIAKYLYDKTGDYRWTQGIVPGAALYNSVVFGDPQNCIDRRKHAKQTQKAA